MVDDTLRRTLKASLTRFILFTAMPREFLINLILNGIVASVLFHDRVGIPVLGWDGLMSMLGPMSFLMPWLTSFFGVFSCAMARKAAIVLPPIPVNSPWLRIAIIIASIHTAVLCPIAIGLVYLVDYSFPGISLNPIVAIVGMGMGSGIVASLIHSASMISYMRSTEDSSMPA